ncbi:MAG: hypothetical protein Q9170_005577 [Blastenia crenularia]
MGTGSLRIIKFRGRNWMFNNSNDGYLKKPGMGDSLVNLIPTDPEKYQQWLQAQRAFYAKWDDQLQKLLCIQPDDLLNIESDKSLEHVWAETFDERLTEPDHEPTYQPGFDEYTYTIDLDLEVFSIDHSAHYRLNHIPRNGDWIKGLYYETRHPRYHLQRRFVFPNFVPAESVASLAIENTNFSRQSLKYWGSLQVKQVSVKLPTRSGVSSILLDVFDVFQQRQLHDLSVNLLSWTASDLPFREIAFFIICLAAGGDHLAIIDERRIIKPCWSQNFAAHISGSGSNGPRELITSVGVGFHLEGEPMGSAPDASNYWFGGVLVCLVPRLSQDDNIKKAIADAVKYGREECGRMSFNAVLISISNLLLFRSFPDGTVESSVIMPLVGTKGSTGMSAEQRHGKEWLDKEYERHLAKQTDAEAETLVGGNESSANEVMAITEDEDVYEGSMQGVEGGMSQDEAEATGLGGLNDSEGPTLNPNEHPCRETQIIATTKMGQRLITNEGAISADDMVVGFAEAGNDLCNAEQAEKIKDTAPTEQQEDESEEEVEESVNEDVQIATEDDAKKEIDEDSEYESVIFEDSWTIKDTFLSLMQFFEATTLEYLKPSSDNGRNLPTEIIKMILDNVADMETFKSCKRVSRSFRSLCLQRPLLMDNIALLDLPLDERIYAKSTEKYPRQINHRAVDLSSGEHMEFHLATHSHRYGSYGDDAQPFYVVAGSEWNRKSFSPDCFLTFPGLDVQAPWYEDPSPSRWSRLFRPRSRSPTPDTFWDKAISHRHTHQYSDSKELCRFWWDEVGPKFFELPDISYRGYLDWYSHSDWLLPPSTKQCFGTTDLSKHKELFHYLLLRIKRASRFRDEDELWSEMIDEAKDYLGKPDLDPDINDEDDGRCDIVVGAADPFVLLTIGLDIRLFKWAQGFDESVTGHARKVASPFGELTEFNPGKTYSLLNTEDRVVIETFMNKAAERLKAAPHKTREEKALYYQEVMSS